MKYLGQTRSVFESGGHYVYAVLCQDGGPLYIKFGRSSSIGSRLSHIKAGSPIPAKWFAVVECKTKGQQARLERHLHNSFAKRRIKGEWFKFYSDRPGDKEEFNQVCRRCFDDVGLKGETWCKISVAQMEAAEKERRKVLVRTGVARSLKSDHKNRLEYGRYRCGYMP